MLKPNPPITMHNPITPTGGNKRPHGPPRFLADIPEQLRRTARPVHEHAGPPCWRRSPVHGDLNTLKHLKYLKGGYGGVKW